VSKSNGKTDKFKDKSILVAGDNTDAQTTSMEVKTRRRSRSQIKEQILTTDPTENYKSTRYTYYGELFVQRLPLWRLWTARMMLTSDPIINFSLNVRNAALSALEVTVKAKNERVATWVKKQWNYLWNQHRTRVVSAKKWGFAPLQCLFKMNKHTGLIDVSGLKDFAPEDARALEYKNKLCGQRIKGIPMFHPQCLWMKFNEEFGSPYGHAVTRRQYPAWYEKWMDHGAKRLVQLRMIKDAYIGDIFWYPPNVNAQLPNGQTIPWRDLMREIGENRLSGAALTLPLLLDSNGKELTRYNPPTGVPGASDIFNWVDYCDDDILKGADVPIEVVKAADTGSGYSGRSIPFLVLLSVCNNEASDIVQCIRDQVLRPLAWLNWGGDVEFEIDPVDLVKSFAGNAAGSPMGGGAIGGQPSQVPQEVPQQQEAAPQGNIQFGEASHKFSSTQFNLVGDLTFKIRQLGDQIDLVDLQPTDYGDDSITGRVLNPHVTVKYGLHTEDADEVRTVVQSQAPVAIQIGRCSFFESRNKDGKPDYDVVKLEVESSGLRKLNKYISDNLECTDTFPDYKPHITIAYVKPGLGPYYSNKLNSLYGEAAVFNRLVFSDKNGTHTFIPLTGAAQFREDKIPGGKGDKAKPEDFDPEQVAMGIKVEMEHTNDPKIALEIAMDHLTEDPHYYTKLKKVEQHEESVGFGKRDAQGKLHAPPGGVTIHGVKYAPGEWIPEDVIESLTPEDKAKLRAGSVARHIKANPKLAKKSEKNKTTEKPKKSYDPPPHIKAGLKANGFPTDKRTAPGSQMPEKLKKKLKDLDMEGTFPPAYISMSDIKVADLSQPPEKLKGKSLLSWRQESEKTPGRFSYQARYTKETREENQDEKWERITTIEPHLSKLHSYLDKAMKTKQLSSRERQAAAIANLIRETGLRPTDSADSVKHGHFGISSLQARHCTIKGDAVQLRFVGKEGVLNKTTVKDPTNVAFLKEMLAGKMPKDFVFTEANSSHANEVLKKIFNKVGGSEDISVKDLRTIKATQIARKLIDEYEHPEFTGDEAKDVKILKKAQLELSGMVSDHLNNTPGMAFKSYIHPEVWKPWLNTLSSTKKEDNNGGKTRRKTK